MERGRIGWRARLYGLETSQLGLAFCSYRAVQGIVDSPSDFAGIGRPARSSF
jgi:hypothetical protein